MPSVLLPANTDAALIAELAGLDNITYPWGAVTAPDGVYFSFPTPRYDEVMQALADYDAESLSRRKTRLIVDINAYRDQVIEGGFLFLTKTIQSRPSDSDNILGLGLAALMAKMAGAQPNDLRWLSPLVDFEWITADNSMLPLDVDGMIGLYQTGVAFKSGATFYAKALKDAVIAAEDNATLDAIDIEVGWPQ